MATRPSTPTPLPDPRSEIRKIEQTFESAFNANDFETLASLYAPDATFLPPNHSPCEGTAQIRDFFRELKQAGASDLHLELGRIEASGDLVAHRGRYRFKAPTAGGGTRPDRGNYLAVYRRQRDGNLRTVFDTFNSELPQ
jgi:uncharacterized protein (TIGR02246 family)